MGKVPEHMPERLKKSDVNYEQHSAAQEGLYAAINGAISAYAKKRSISRMDVLGALEAIKLKSFEHWMEEDDEDGAF